MDKASTSSASISTKEEVLTPALMDLVLNADPKLAEEIYAELRRDEQPIRGGKAKDPPKALPVGEELRKIFMYAPRPAKIRVKSLIDAQDIAQDYQKGKGHQRLVLAHPVDLTVQGTGSSSCNTGGQTSTSECSSDPNSK